MESKFVWHLGVEQFQK